MIKSKVKFYIINYASTGMIVCLNVFLATIQTLCSVWFCHVKSKWSHTAGSTHDTVITIIRNLYLMISKLLFTVIN